jgi:hypothetical protein
MADENHRTGEVRGRGDDCGADVFPLRWRRGGDGSERRDACRAVLRFEHSRDGLPRRSSDEGTVHEDEHRGVGAHPSSVAQANT